MIGMREWFAGLDFGGAVNLVVIVIAALSTVLEVSKIKINPWSWLAGIIGRAMNQELIEKVDSLSTDVRNLKKSVDERDAKAARGKILEFGDDLIFNPERKHSKDMFDDVVQRITEYDTYCNEHPDFKNHRTTTTSKLILDTYEKCMREHSFL